MNPHNAPVPTILMEDDTSEDSDLHSLVDQKTTALSDSGISSLSAELSDCTIREPSLCAIPEMREQLAFSMLPELDANFSPPSGFEHFDNPGAIDYSNPRDVSRTTQFLTQISVGESRVERPYHSMQVPNEKQKLYFAPMDDEGNTGLHHAILQKDIRMVIEIVREASDSSYLNIQNRSFMTPLHFAVQEEFHQAVAILINRGANIRKFDEKGNTPLHTACGQGEEVMIQVIVRFVMEKGHRLGPEKIKEILDTKNYDGCTCFHLVVSTGNAAAIRTVAKYGANVDAGDGKSGRTALHLAVEAANIELASFLIQEIGVNPNCETFNDDTALTLAKGRNMPMLAELLLKFGGTESQTSLNREAESDGDDLF